MKRPKKISKKPCKPIKIALRWDKNCKDANSSWISKTNNNNNNNNSNSHNSFSSSTNFHPDHQIERNQMILICVKPNSLNKIGKNYSKKRFMKTSQQQLNSGNNNNSNLCLWNSWRKSICRCTKKELRLNSQYMSIIYLWTILHTL